MIQFRETIIKKIIQASNNNSIETTIDSSIKKLIENNVNQFIIVRFINKLKESLNELRKTGATPKEIENIAEACIILTDYKFSKLTTNIK